jgi:hypothetical protein
MGLDIQLQNEFGGRIDGVIDPKNLLPGLYRQMKKMRLIRCSRESTYMAIPSLIAFKCRVSFPSGGSCLKCTNGGRA